MAEFLNASVHGLSLYNTTSTLSIHSNPQAFSVGCFLGVLCRMRAKKKHRAKKKSLTEAESDVHAEHRRCEWAFAVEPGCPAGRSARARTELHRRPSKAFEVRRRIAESETAQSCERKTDGIGRGSEFQNQPAARPLVDGSYFFFF